MFDNLEIAPPDPILGLEEAFKRDTNPAKINLAAGVYRDETGQHPRLSRGQARGGGHPGNRDQQDAISGMAGLPEFTAAVQALVFGEGHPIIAERRATTVQAPGGTGGAARRRRLHPQGKPVVDGLGQPADLAESPAAVPQRRPGRRNLPLFRRRSTTASTSTP